MLGRQLSSSIGKSVGNQDIISPDLPHPRSLHILFIPWKNINANEADDSYR